MRSKPFLSELEAHGFTFCTVLNRGRSGDVYECVMGKRKQSVAIKIPHKDHNNNGEACILRHLMKWRMNESNIVTCLEEFTHDDSEILVFEKLDVNLQKYICQSHCKPMPLTHIREVVKQMGSALSALSITGIIHADIKPSNIMIAKPNHKPFQIKLIDFGSALSTSDAKQGSTLGTIGFMSPEIMLGLPFTQATDVWSLGCVVGYLMLGYPLFSTQSEYKAFKAIHQIIGQPSDECLDRGLYTSKFYKECNNKWSPVEARMDYNERLTSLDDLKPMKVGLFNKLEPIQREQCVDLLKKMLQINPEDRITPEEIKKHPFVTGHYQRKSSPWSRFMPFKKNNKVSPLEPENQLSQHTLNTLPSEKPEVYMVPRVSETTAKTVNPFSRRSQIFPLNEGQKTYATSNVEVKREPHSSRRLKDPGSNMAPTSFNSQPSEKRGVIWVPPVSGPTPEIEELRKSWWHRRKHREITEPKLKNNEMSVKDHERPSKPSLHRVIMVKPALKENTISQIDSDKARVTESNVVGSQRKVPSCAQTTALDNFNRFVMLSQQGLGHKPNENLKMNDANRFRGTSVTVTKSSSTNYENIIPVCDDGRKKDRSSQDYCTTGLTTIGESVSSLMQKEHKSNVVGNKTKVPSCAQTNALDNWNRNMELRRRQQDHLSRLVHRPPEHLQMNDANRFREIQEKKEMLNQAFPLVNSGYGLTGSGLWRLPERYGDEPSGITATLTKADIGIKEPVTHVGLASSIRQESGLKEEHTVNDAYLTWDQSIYLKQQCQMLGEAVRDLDFNRPDINKLEVIGSSKPDFSETCGNPSSKDGTVTPVLLDLTPFFVEEVEDHAMERARHLWKQKVRICTVPYDKLTTEEKEMYRVQNKLMDSDMKSRSLKADETTDA